MDILKALYESVQTRPRPEDVAALIEEVLPLTAREKATLAKATAGSLKKHAYAYSSMAADFTRPVSAEKQVKTAATVFSIGGTQVTPLSAAECMNPTRVEEYVRTLGETIHKVYGDKTRLTKAQRREVGLFKVQRWYNKRFRILCRMEEKIGKLAWNIRKYEFTRVGKSALATKLSYEDFSAHLPTACFVAYLSAKMNKRSVFTNASQEKAFDEIAAMLLNKADSAPGTRWDVIAHVYPEERVLRHLKDEQKGRLLGAWWSLLADMADMMRDIAQTMSLNRSTMIVARGNDSSTWNQVALGWNTARGHWISVLYALKMESLLTEICPGKVMRLMAADVAAWHQMSGGGIHPDTAVWAALPPPWDVIRGERVCSRQIVETACLQNNVDPEKWTGFKKGAVPTPFKPTPELVHGVAVSSAFLAAALRKAGVFSGKGSNGEAPPFEVVRDELGFALTAGPAGVEQT